MDSQRRQASLRMIQEPSSWPIWPRLPLKRGWDNNPNVGVLVAWDDNLWYWYPGKNLYDTELVAPVELDLTGIENLLDEGWTVD